MSLGDVTGAVGSVVPEEQRKRFFASPLGGLLGQMVMLLVTGAIYLGVLVVIFQFRSLVEGAIEWVGPAVFWSVLAAPLPFILLFQFLPAALQARREARLHRLAISASERSPGVFRLFPYGPGDADAYQRPDGADDAAVAWLEASRRSLLYLFGASGSGKSSLLGAAVLPRLEAKGWATLTLRVYDDPAQQFRAALLERKDLFDKAPSRGASLRALLERAAQERARAGAPPLLVVIDQFEEFLILHDDAARAPLIEVLHGLDADPLPGLRLLCVFRSDYRELLFKLGLPRYQPGVTAFELAPFLRAEAEAFLRKGGRALTPEGYAALFAGLDRIEEARGLYRPITLNMVGLVLDRMGDRIAGDPARLIDAYLRDCLSAGASRDFARPVLAAMITAAGTKEPRDLDAIAGATGLARWQVESTLADLEGKGLLRPIDQARSRWEVSHDFLARQIGMLLGRLRAPWLRRAAPVALTVAAAGWAAALFLLLVWWPGERDRRALAALSEIGVTRVTERNLEVSAQPASAPLGVWLIADRADFDSRGLTVLVEALGGLRNPPSWIDLSDTDVDDLAPLAGITAPTRLDLSYTNVVDLKPLAGMTALEWLDLSYTNVVDLAPLAGMTALRWLDLTYTDVVDLAPLRGIDPSAINGVSDTVLATLRRPASSAGD